MKQTKVWIVAYTKPKHENTAKNLLELKGYKVLMPLIKRKRIWSDRTKWIKMPLFPSYIFVQCRLNESIFILQTQGIVKLVNFNGKAAVINNNEIIALEGIIANRFNPNEIDYFIKGEKALVINGPLKGYYGEVIKLNNDENKLIIRIDAIKQSFSISISKNNLLKK